MQAQQVGEREAWPVLAFIPVQFGQFLRQGDEVRFKRFLVGVEVADVDILHACRRERRHHDAGLRCQFLRRQLVDVVGIENCDHSIKRIIQFHAIRMAAILQRFQRLLLDGAAGNQPDHQRAVALQVVDRCRLNEVRAHQRLAAACGNADGDIRHILQRGNVEVVFVAQWLISRHQSCFAVGVRMLGERTRDTMRSDIAQVVFKGCQRLGLVVFQFHECLPRPDVVRRLFEGDAERAQAVFGQVGACAEDDFRAIVRGQPSEHF